MEQVNINKSIKLSEHFTLGEVTKSRHAEIYNIPSHVAIENLKRVCGWLEELRRRYNLRYVLRSVSPLKLGGARGGLNERYNSHCSDHPAHTGTPPNLGGETERRTYRRLYRLRSSSSQEHTLFRFSIATWLGML